MIHRVPVIADNRISVRIPTSPLTGRREPKKGVHCGGQPGWSRNFIGKIRVNYTGLVSRRGYGRLGLLPYFSSFSLSRFDPNSAFTLRYPIPDHLSRLGVTGARERNSNQIYSLSRSGNDKCFANLSHHVSTLFPLSNLAL
jgi:hypothetical protein